MTPPRVVIITYRPGPLDHIGTVVPYIVQHLFQDSPAPDLTVTQTAFTCAEPQLDMIVDVLDRLDSPGSLHPIDWPVTYLAVCGIPGYLREDTARNINRYLLQNGIPGRDLAWDDQGVLYFSPVVAQEGAHA